MQGAPGSAAKDHRKIAALLAARDALVLRVERCEQPVAVCGIRVFRADVEVKFGHGNQPVGS